MTPEGERRSEWSTSWWEENTRSRSEIVDGLHHFPACGLFINRDCSCSQIETNKHVAALEAENRDLRSELQDYKDGAAAEADMADELRRKLEEAERRIDSILNDADRLREERDAALSRGLTWGRETDEALARAEAAERYKALSPRIQGLLGSPDCPPLPWTSPANQGGRPWPNEASDPLQIVDANGKPLFRSRNWKEACVASELIVLMSLDIKARYDALQQEDGKA